ncbi:hypothetical protein SAMN05421743_12152 [Thalassobacillus cyri]|uniref:Uncharacterized protein n=1 Tax=Thalassobacillus cyri TaxID=571932 RepID=A0A1H4H1X5_9BACI|nr:hypothetical protein [Thalassobacillus cyri]SEB15839.1 hypothetical protein SAMN05421743_12152 [Thalassobacillus cyri]
MTRKLSARLDEEADLIAFFLEDESTCHLTIIKDSLEDEHYFIPPISLTFKSIQEIDCLHNILISGIKDLDLFDKNKLSYDMTSTSHIISTDAPIIMGTIVSGKLKLIESDYFNDSVYKPAKQIILRREQLKILYKLLNFILGEPITMKFNYDIKKHKIRKDVPSGWDLLQ